MMKKWWIVAALLVTSVKLSAETVGDKLGDAYQAFVDLTNQQAVKDVLAPGQNMFLTSLGKTVKKNVTEVTPDQLERVIFKLNDFRTVVSEALQRANKAKDIVEKLTSSADALKTQFEELKPKQAPQAMVVTTNKSGQPVLHVQGVSAQTDADTLEMSGPTDEEFASLDKEEAQALMRGDVDVLEVVGIDEGESSTDSPVEEVELDLPIHPSLFTSRSHREKMLNYAPHVFVTETDVENSPGSTSIEDRIHNILYATSWKELKRLAQQAENVVQDEIRTEEDLDMLLAELTEAQAARLLSEIEDEELLAKLTAAEATELAQWIKQGMPNQAAANGVAPEVAQALGDNFTTLNYLYSQGDTEDAFFAAHQATETAAEAARESAQKTSFVETLETLNRIAADAEAVREFLAPHQHNLRTRIERAWDGFGRVLTRDEIRQDVLVQVEKHQLNEEEYALAIDAFVNAFATLQDIMWNELEPVYGAQPLPLGKRKRTNKGVEQKAKHLKMEEKLDAATVLRRAEEALAQSRAQVGGYKLATSPFEFDRDSLGAALEAAEENEAKQLASARKYEEFLTELNKLAFSDAERLSAFFELHRDNFQSKIERLYSKHKRNLTHTEMTAHLLRDLRKLALSEQKFETAVSLLAQYLVDLQGEMAVKRAAISKALIENPPLQYGSIGARGAVKMRPMLGGRELSQSLGTVPSVTMEDID